MATLLDYAPRYRAVVGSSFEPGVVEIVGRVEGNATTDFEALAVAALLLKRASAAISRSTTSGAQTPRSSCSD